MALTLKQNLDQILGERGFATETAYAAATGNPPAVQMLYLANAAVADIQENGYQKLRKQATISMTTDTEYDLPSDFHEYVPDTGYVDGRLDPVDMPTTPGMWAFIRAGGPNSFMLRVRFLGGQVQVLNPVDEEDLTFEYVSNTPIQATGAGALKSRFDADTDVWLLDDRLLQLETLWRWEKVKGFADWQASLAIAKAHRIAVRGREAGAKTLTPMSDAAPIAEPYTNLWRP